MEPFLVASPRHLQHPWPFRRATMAMMAMMAIHRLGIAMQRRGAVHQVELLQILLYHLQLPGIGEQFEGNLSRYTQGLMDYP